VKTERQEYEEARAQLHRTQNLLHDLNDALRTIVTQTRAHTSDSLVLYPQEATIVGLRLALAEPVPPGIIARALRLKHDGPGINVLESRLKDRLASHAIDYALRQEAALQHHRPLYQWLREHEPVRLETWSTKSTNP
jgi:hypothetical protein